MVVASVLKGSEASSLAILSASSRISLDNLLYLKINKFNGDLHT